MSTQVFESKLQTETVNVVIDMLSRLEQGESFTTVASAMSVEVGTDANPSLMLDGDPVLTETLLSQRVKGGLPGVIYKLALSARTDGNNIYINEVKIAVLPDDAAIPA